MSDSLSNSDINNNGLTKKISSVFSAIRKDPYSTFQIRFKDRLSAANILTATLQDRIGKDLKIKEEIFILGIPRGGVIIANVLADKLKIQNFDIVIPRKLTDIDNKEQAIGAIMEDGTTYLDEELISDLQIDSKYLEEEKHLQLKEIERRKSLYRKSENNHLDLINNKIVIIVDDGAASGATVIVVARWIKKNYSPRKIVLAIPVVPKKSLTLLEKEYDKVIAVTTPSKYFNYVGQYYKSFTPIGDSEVITIMQQKYTREKTSSRCLSD